MSRFSLALRRAFWLLCVCALLLPGSAAAAEPLLAIDFDGDGKHDRVTDDRHEPRILHVWLSASGTTQIIRTRVPLMRVVAVDLDGDHRPELIARDSESKIHVWTRNHKGFHSYRPRKVVQGTWQQPNRRSVDDSDPEPIGAIAGTAFATLALSSHACPAAPLLEASYASAFHTTGRRSLTPVDPFAPRPPPTRVAL